MLEENQTEVEEVEASTTEDVESESSTEELEEATSQEAVQEEIQQVPYDRFQQVNDAKNKAEQEASYYKGLSERPAEAPIATTDPDANLDPQTKIFYQDLEKRTQAQITKAISEKAEEYDASLRAIASQNAKLQEKLFRQEQTDVVKDSPEEMEIANMIRMGVDPDKAAWAVMGPKRVESAQTKGVQKKQIKAQQKAEANLEVSGIPTSTGAPTGEKLSFRQSLDKAMRESGQ